jgi:hypothetical protein
MRATDGSRQLCVESQLYYEVTNQIPTADLKRTYGLTHEMSSPARSLGSWVQIPLEARMYVCVLSVVVLSCEGSGLATG